MNNVYHSFLRVGENTKKNWESQFTVSICLTLPSDCLGNENQFALALKAFITIHFLDKSLNNIVALNATNGKKLGKKSLVAILIGKFCPLRQPSRLQYFRNTPIYDQRIN